MSQTKATVNEKYYLPSWRFFLKTTHNVAKFHICFWSEMHCKCDVPQIRASGMGYIMPATAEGIWLARIVERVPIRLFHTRARNRFSGVNKFRTSWRIHNTLRMHEGFAPLMLLKVIDIWSMLKVLSIIALNIINDNRWIENRINKINVFQYKINSLYTYRLDWACLG